MPSALRRLSKKLALSLTSLVLILGGAELVCRAAGYAPSKDRVRWMAHPQLQAMPMPDQRTWAGKDDPQTGEERLRITFNRYGQRGSDYPLEREPGELRLAAVGDSLTMGKGVGDEESYPAILAELLAGRPDAPGPVRVINAGVNGWSTWHYMRWAETQIERFRPDALVVGLFLGNDMIIPRNAAQAIPVPLENTLRESALYGFLIQVYRRHLWKKVEAARRDLSIEELDAELDRYKGVAESQLSAEDQELLWERNSVPHLERMRDACRAHGVDLACLLLPTYAMAQAEEEPALYGFLRSRLGELGVPVLEVRDALHAEGPAAWLPWDVGHLSPHGNRVVAERVLEGLQRLELAR